MSKRLCGLYGSSFRKSTIGYNINNVCLIDSQDNISTTTNAHKPAFLITK